MDSIRREMVQDINSTKIEVLKAEHGRLWTAGEMSKEFEAIGFSAPFIVVRRRSDGVKGTLMFCHSPRYYFSWQEDL